MPKEKMFYGDSRVGKTFSRTCDLCHKFVLPETVTHIGPHWFCKTCAEIVENAEKTKEIFDND
jgi:hypothetical protein